MSEAAPDAAPPSAIEEEESVVLETRAVRGTVLTIAGYGTTQLLRFLSNLLLSRLLFPEAFGLMALVNAFVQGLNMLSDLGLGPIVVQSRRGDDRRFLDTVWTVQAIRGLILWLTACAIAWPLAEVYGEALLASMLPVAGLAMLITGFSSTARFSCNRRLQVGRVIAVDLGGQVVGLVVMGVLAYVHRSVWALVSGTVVIAASRVLLLRAAIPDSANRFAWDRDARNVILKFGRWVFLSTVITYFALQADRLLLGKLVEIRLLGIYSMALVVAALPLQLATQLFDSVVYPVLADRARNRPETFEGRMAQARSVLLPCGVLAMLAVLHGSPVLFGLLFDDRYVAGGWIAQLLTVPLWFAILHASTGRALWALGDSRSLTLCNLINLAGTVAGCVAGHALAGLVGFILGIALGRFAAHVVCLVYLARRGVRVYGQDLTYSLLYGTLAASGASACYAASEWLGIVSGVVANAVAFATVSLAGTLWALRRWNSGSLRL